MMRIIGVLDKESYSIGIIPALARLSANTWSDVTLVMLGAKGEPFNGLVKALREVATKFFEMSGGYDGPYRLDKELKFIQECQNGLCCKCGGKKHLVLKIRLGDYAKEILEEASNSQSDLIVLGCSKEMNCEWHGVVGLPLKIANDASCSVLIIKETTSPRQIISFLDQTNVSQESLELINQMVTIHGAGLKIVGLMSEKGIVGKQEVERKMLDILAYYNEKKMNAWITIVEKDKVQEFVTSATREGLVALWMGKRSFFSRIFSKNLLSQIIEHARSSILILR